VSDPTLPGEEERIEKKKWEKPGGVLYFSIGKEGRRGTVAGVLRRPIKKRGGGGSAYNFFSTTSKREERYGLLSREREGPRSSATNDPRLEKKVPCLAGGGGGEFKKNGSQGGKDRTAWGRSEGGGVKAL